MLKFAVNELLKYGHDKDHSFHVDITNATIILECLVKCGKVAGPHHTTFFGDSVSVQGDNRLILIS